MPLRLDERLLAIAGLVEGNVVCDVGTDHGKLPCFLVRTDRVKRAIVTDISRSSLDKAAILAEESGLGDRISARLGDGLDPVDGCEADCVVIAGLGGDVIAGIIARASAAGKNFGCYVLSPNTHAEKVRDAVWDAGHGVIYDREVVCGGKLYTVIKTRRSDKPEKPDELRRIFGMFYDTDADFLARAAAELEVLEAACSKNPAAEGLAGRVKLLKRALGR